MSMGKDHLTIVRTSDISEIIKSMGTVRGYLKDQRYFIYIILCLGVEEHRYGFKFMGEWWDNHRHGKMTYYNPMHEMDQIYHN